MESKKLKNEVKVEASSPVIGIRKYFSKKGKAFYKIGEEKALTIERKGVGIYHININQQLLIDIPIEIKTYE